MFTLKYSMNFYKKKNNIKFSNVEKNDLLYKNDVVFNKKK